MYSEEKAHGICLWTPTKRKSVLTLGRGYLVWHAGKVLYLPCIVPPATGGRTVVLQGVTGMMWEPDSYAATHC